MVVRAELETRTYPHSDFDFPTRLHGGILVLWQVEDYPLMRDGCRLAINQLHVL
jgi:hypothetical protein